MTVAGDILILGIGASGQAAARYCAARVGEEVASVTLVDAAAGDSRLASARMLESLGVRVILGTDSVSGSYSLGIASPGIPPHSALMMQAFATCDEVISEIEFAYRCSNNPWIAVTGTNGKTTTTALITHLLRTGGTAARAVGNFGPPAISAVESAEPEEVLVAEVSSFQLALTSRFHPRCAVLLNITPDHIDWHGSLEVYESDKAKVFANLGEGDCAVIDVDDPGSAPWAEKVAMSGARVVKVSRESVTPGGASLVDGELTLANSSGRVALIDAGRLRILGPHNVNNALAAAAAAHAMGLPVASIAEGLSTFAPIEHRLEPVGDLDGAEWFNDSKATNPDAVIKALRSFEDRQIILLAGGRNKGNEFSELAVNAIGRVRRTIAFGEAGPEIARDLRAAGLEVDTVAGLGEAVALAARIANVGDAVLLSPACASYDEFASYEHRGREFKSLFGSLAKAQP